MCSNSQNSGSPTTETVWPQSLPTQDEDKFLSITICDSEAIWAVHELDDDSGQNMHTFKSQLRLDKDLVMKSNRSQRIKLLRANLPTESKIAKSVDYLYDFIFSTRLGSTYEDDNLESFGITTYIVGTNALNVRNLWILLRSIHHRVFVMKTTDFFLQFEREDSKLRVDRSAALRGSAHIHGFPAIVFDFSDEITITAAGWDGRLFGESVSSGLWQRLQCLSGTNSNLSTLSEDRVKEVIYEVVNNDSKNKKSLSIFANNPFKSTIAAALSEVSNHARYLHRIWLKKVGSPTRKPKKEQKRDTFNFCRENYNRTGSVTGKQRKILQKLLKEDHGGLIECPKTKSQKQSDEEKIEEIPVTPFQHLISFGIHNTILRMRHILLEKGEEVFNDFLNSTNMKYIKKEKKSSKKKRIPDDVSDENVMKKTKTILVKKTLCSEKNNDCKKTKKKSSEKQKDKSPQENQDKQLIHDEKNEKGKSNPISLDPSRHHHKKIYKRFNNDPKPYLGEITSHSEYEGEILWQVKYEDDDEEELDEGEVLEGLKLFASIQNCQHNAEKVDYKYILSQTDV